MCLYKNGCNVVYQGVWDERRLIVKSYCKINNYLIESLTVIIHSFDVSDL